VEFDKVSHAYEDGVPVLIKSASVQSPDRPLRLSPTGAGKTTIINLIPRFYDVTHAR